MKITNKILIAALAAFSFACEDPEYPTPVPSTATATTNVAGFNFWANNQSLDFLYDNAAVGQTNLALGANSGSTALYSSVKTGLHTIGFDSTGKRTATTTQATFLKGKYYSVFATDVSAPLIVTESFPAAVDGKAQVRFLQLSASADTAEVVDTATVASVIFSSRAFRAATTTITAFKAIDAGQVNWRIRQNTKKTTTKYSPIDVVETFSAGKNYTVVLRGSVTGSGSLGLGYTVIQHN
ncbi:DUF4397 domain-containing protein [Flexibacter flexilis]|nr:DUF4397 domain-containing protein [Flexibacter flexilis]